ncbi:MAG: DUF3782 domain-containing protein [Magnetococcales bacterium]|nr:DUF3782 domain-containing protein [Magnetococcales bacterium]
MFQETNRLFQESQQNWELRSQESQQKWELRSKEADKKMQELTASQKETDRQMQITDKKIKEVSTLVGNLGSRWGDFIEGIVAPASTTLFAEWGIPVHKVTRNVKAYLPGKEMEIDVLVVNTTAIVLVEVKSRLQYEHIQEHVDKLKEFKEFFPEYANRQVIGAVAGIVIDEHVDRHAMKQGMFVIVQSGDGVKLANGLGFVPKSW